MSSDALIACLSLWIAFCVLLIFCASFEGRAILWVIVASIVLTPVAGILLMIYFGLRRRARTLRGCPYCLQLIEPLATACHHCLRPVPAAYIKDRPKEPVLVYCFSVVGLLVGIGLMVVVWISSERDDRPQTSPAVAAYVPPPMPEPTPASPPQTAPVDAFGKQWVQLKDGETIYGIVKVLPASDRQVTLITVDSGRNVSEDDLPTGFLKQWETKADDH